MNKNWTYFYTYTRTHTNRSKSKKHLTERNLIGRYVNGRLGRRPVSLALVFVGLAIFEEDGFVRRHDRIVLFQDLVGQNIAAKETFLGQCRFRRCALQINLPLVCANGHATTPGRRYFGLFIRIVVTFLVHLRKNRFSKWSLLSGNWKYFLHF